VVGWAANGAEALEVVRACQPDLALLDLGMPGVGGIDVLADLLAASPRTQVVVVSGSPRGRLAPLAHGHGAVGYVEKGLSAKAMVNSIVSVAGLLEAVQSALLERSRAHLERDPRSSAAARRFVGETLSRWECGGVLDTVNLLVSELVTNSVLHTRSAADIAVLLTPDSVRIEVSDQGEGIPRVREAGENATSGRGLAMVEALASAWGVETTPLGKTVWFEVSRGRSGVDIAE